MRPRKTWICIVEGCGKNHSARGYCHNHYELFLRNGNPNYKKPKYENCKIDNCQNGKPFVLGYCQFHYTRLRCGTPLDSPKWNSKGLSEYPNHYEMKQNRLIKFEQNNGRCQMCGKKAKISHHIDQSKNNHNLNNLMPLCFKCHHKLHPKKTSILTRLYGTTIEKLSSKLNLPMSKIYILHKTNHLAELLH